MNLQNLKYFSDSARLKSMTKAALLNHLSRPAVSQAILKLEDELGVKLLVHKRRSFELTQAGLTLLKRSENLFHHVEETAAAVKTTTGPISGEFRIGAARTLANFSLHSAIEKMKDHYPDVDYRIFLQNSQTLIDKLENRELDLAFFIGDHVINGFKQIVIGRGSYCLVKPQKLKIETATFAMTERRPETERLKVLFERQYGEEIKLFAEIPSWDIIWSWIHAGACGGLIPDFMMDEQNSKHLDVVFKKVFPYEIKVMFHKSKAQNPLVMRFLEGLR